MNKKKKTFKKTFCSFLKDERGILPCILGFLFMILIAGILLYTLVPAGIQMGKKENKSGESIGSPGADCAEIPGKYIPIYKAATNRYPMPWQLLPAVHKIESGFSTNMGPSSAGAQGPMQFMPATWEGYKNSSAGISHVGVDHVHNEPIPSILDDIDSIFAATNNLSANGASTNTEEGIKAALFNYNHADWYVSAVYKDYESYLKTCN